MDKVIVITALVLVNWPVLSQVFPSKPPIPFGIIGTRAPADFYVTDVAFDNEGNIYTVDNFHKTVSKYAPNGTLKSRFTDAKFIFPRYLSIDSSGRIYVVDSGRAEARVYSNAGELIGIWSGIRGPGEIDIDEFGSALVVLRGDPGTPFLSDQVLVFDLSGKELFRFGAAGSIPGKFNTPVGVSGGVDGSIWVTDVGNQRIQKFDSDGNILFATGRLGSNPGEFIGPRSTAVDSLGNVFVSDRRNERVQKLDQDGNFLTAWGQRGIGPGLFLEMEGLEVAPDDTVWVAGFHAHDIQHFDNQGNFLDRWEGRVSGPGEFAHAKGIGVSAEKLFVIDHWNQNVQVFDADSGNFLFDFGERNQGDATVFNFPRALTIGPEGDLYISDDDNIRRIMQDGTFVARFPRPSGRRIGSHGLVITDDGILFQADTGNHRINVVDTITGLILRQWGERGSQSGQFNTPWGIAIGPDTTVYVADANNKRVQRFTQDGALIDSWNINGAARALSIDTSRNIIYVGTWNKIDAFDLDGNFIFSWGRLGTAPGEFIGVYDIKLDLNGDVIYTSETDNARVQRYIYPSAFDGKPVFNPGNDFGYYIWKDSDDGEWHIRFSSDGVSRSYALTVTSEEGFNNVNGTNLQPADKLSQSENVVSLEGRVSNWQAGVDFVTPEETNLNFNLSIDNQTSSVPVSVGRKGIQANISAFGL